MHKGNAKISLIMYSWHMLPTLLNRVICSAHMLCIKLCI